MTYASFLQRISGALIDSVIFLFVVSFLLRGQQDDPQAAGLYFFGVLIAALMFAAIVSVRYSGTPGNLLLNCQIVDARTGRSISMKQSVRRSLGIFLTLATLGIGFLWILVSKNKQALHDKISGTVVVYNGTLDRFDESQKTLRQLLSEVR